MEPNERDKIMGRVSAAWPKPPMAASTAMAWNDHLTRLRFDQADEAVLNMEMALVRQPTIADLFSHYNALNDKYATKTKALRKPHCGMCDNGYVPSRCNTRSGSCDCGDAYVALGNVCPKGYSVIAKCPNGCKPRTQEEWAEFYRIEDEKVARERRERRERHEGPLKFDRSVLEQGAGVRRYEDEFPKDEVF